MQELKLFVPIYADDMVIFSESIHKLQEILNTFYIYISSWDLDVNARKTKLLFLEMRKNL